MARHKAVAKTSEGAKRGRPGKGTGAAEENGIEKATPKVNLPHKMAKTKYFY
uniref:Uncharacterized protein n=1 Tax=Parascaris equorum TaxID=6256 RepID=A0A914R9E9_PAREQ